MSWRGRQQRIVDRENGSKFGIMMPVSRPGWSENSKKIVPVLYFATLGGQTQATGTFSVYSSFGLKFIFTLNLTETMTWHLVRLGFLVLSSTSWNQAGIFFFDSISEFALKMLVNTGSLRVSDYKIHLAAALSMTTFIHDCKRTFFPLLSFFPPRLLFLFTGCNHSVASPPVIGV